VKERGPLDEGLSRFSSILPAPSSINLQQTIEDLERAKKVSLEQPSTLNEMNFLDHDDFVEPLMVQWSLQVS